MSGIFAENATTHEAFSRGKYPTARFGQQGFITNASGFAGTATTIGKQFASKTYSRTAATGNYDITSLPGRYINATITGLSLSGNVTILLPTAASIVQYLKHARTQSGALPLAGAETKMTVFETVIINNDPTFNISFTPGAGDTFQNGSPVIAPQEAVILKHYVTSNTPGSESVTTWVESWHNVRPNTEEDLVVSSGTWAAADANSARLEFIADGNYRVVGISAMPTVDASAAANFTVQKITGGAVGNQMLSSAISLNGTGDLTRVEGNLTSTVADLKLSEGDGVQITLGNDAATNLAGAIVQIRLKKIG